MGIKKYKKGYWYQSREIIKNSYNEPLVWYNLYPVHTK